MRNLLIFVLFLIVVWWLRGVFFRPRNPSHQHRKPSGHSNDGTEPAQVEAMRPCAHCGVHVPETEGIQQDGRFFCSQEHRLLGVRDK